MNSSIIYDNGADVNTSFITNIYPNAPSIVVDGRLNKIFAEVQKENLNRYQQPKYSYPLNVVTAAILGKIATYNDEVWTIPANKTAFIRRLDTNKKGILEAVFCLPTSRQQSTKKQ